MAISGKFEADFASFQTAVEGAELQLKSFESGGAKVAAQMNRVSDSLSGRKLIQDATLAAEAVDRIGGVSKLTEQELARLSAQATQAVAKLTALGIDVPVGIQKIAAAAKSAHTETSSWMGDFLDQAKATALGMVSAQAAVALVKEGWQALSEFVAGSVASYANSEAAAKKMTTALQAQGTASADNIKDFNALATEFQRTTTNSDDLINEMEALLTQIGGVAPSEMRKALKAATDLAAGLGIDLRTATLMVAKASEENVAALKKAGVQLDATRVAGEGMEYILGKIEERFGGQAQGEVETYSGKIKQLKNDWDNFQEAVGKSIVQDPLLIGGLKLAQERVAQLSAEASGATPTITQYWAALAGADTSVGLITAFSEILRLVQSLDAEVAKMKPPDPKAFTDYGDDFKALNAESDALVKSMVAGWVEEDKAAAKTAADVIRLQKEKDRAFEQSAALQTQLMSDILTEQQRSGASADQQAQLDLDNRMAREIAAVRANTHATQQEIDTSVALIELKYAGLSKKIGSSWDEISKHSIVSQQDLANHALDDYNKMVAAGGYFRDELEKQYALYQKLALAATASGHDQVAAEDSATDATNRHTDAILRQHDIVQQALAAQGQDMQSTLFGSGPLDDKNKTVQTLGGERITPAEAKKRFDSGGDRDYSDPANLNRPAMSVEDFIRAFGNNIDAGAAAYNADQAARARGRAALSLSSTIPLSGGRGDTHVTVPVSVNGVLDPVTIRDLSDKVSAAVVSKLTLGRQLSYG